MKRTVDEREDDGKDKLVLEMKSIRLIFV